MFLYYYILICFYSHVLFVAKEKLQLVDDVMIFTEKDGFLVDDNHILEHVYEQPLMVSNASEQWKPPQSTEFADAKCKFSTT